MVHLARGGLRILWEAGDTSSYRALVAYEPVSGACVVLLKNTGASANEVGETAREMMRRMLQGYSFSSSA